MQSKIYAPENWGKLKSNTHYALIDNEINALRPLRDFVLYKGRWRPIDNDGFGGTFIDIPGAIIFFEIKEFDKKS